MRISLTSRSSSLTVTGSPLDDDEGFPAGSLGDAGHRDDVVAAHDDRPRVPLRPRHLRVHEQILHLLAASREPIAGTARPDLQSGLVGAEAPRPPFDLSFEAQRVVLADRANAAAEVTRLRALERGEQLCERALQPPREERA